MALIEGLTIAAGVFQGLSELISAKNEADKEEAAIREAEYNAKQLRYDALMARYEKAQAFNQQMAKGRQNIATGFGSMAARGNYGTSAQAQIFGSALNLMKDLSAIQYKYDNDAIQRENAARILEYNAKQHEKSKASAILGGLIGAGSAGAKTYLSGWDRGIWPKNK